MASVPTFAATLELLEHGRVEVLGLLPYSSNYTFLARISDGTEVVSAVYKPRRGERPLWDFPSGTLAARERAAFLVSEAAGWHICLLYTSPSPRDRQKSRMPSSA